MIKSLLLIKYLRNDSHFRSSPRSAFSAFSAVNIQTYSQDTRSHNILTKKTVCCGNLSNNNRFCGYKFFNFQDIRTFSTSNGKYSFRDWLAEYYVKKEKRTIWINELKETYTMAALVNATPKQWQPYLRLARVDKPIGTWLLYLPCAFSISLATPFGQLPSFYYLSLFALGAFLMRGAGCVINDLWDRDLDKNVERTKDRPIASGQVSPRNSILLLAGQLSLSLGILLSLNATCIVIGFASMVPVIIYPLMKRITYFPQVVLGLTFNMGALMGYTAVTGSMNLLIQIPLYIGCCMWTIFYDTIYALQDMTDDMKTGIMSTALLFYKRKTPEEGLSTVERLQEQEKPKQTLEMYLLTFFAAAVLGWSVSMTAKGVAGPAYLMVILVMIRNMEKAKNFNPLSRNSCWERFVDNKIIGFLFLAGIIGGIYIMKPWNRKANESQQA